MRKAQRKSSRKHEREVVDLGGTLLCLWTWEEEI